MLVQLTISNFALIAQAQLQFPKGYSTITGETGSGKSIFLGALNLILGERADFSVIRDTDKKTIVEAVFQLNENQKHWFDENDIDWDNETVIRREITAQGKSRAFVNDTPVSLNVLKELTEQLVYIHSQHQTLELKDERFQLNLVDTFAQLGEETTVYRTQLRVLKHLIQQRNELEKRLIQVEQESDYTKFQLNELDELDLDARNYAQLNDELTRLDKIDDIKQIYGLLAEGITSENGPLDVVRMLKSQLDKWKNQDVFLAQSWERIQSVLVELQDLSDSASDELEKLEVDPARKFELEQTLDKYFRVLKKYNLSDQNELLQYRDNLQNNATNADELRANFEQLEPKILGLEKELKQLGNLILKKRQEEAPKLAQHLVDLLNELKLPDVQLILQVEQLNEFTELCGSTVQLLFSANKGMAPKSIDKSASGGELSRLMLAVQATLSSRKSLPTMLLDEIDTGVSGEVALRIGKLLRKMGENMQLLSITHLPQVAALGETQFEVSKSSIGNETNTKLTILTQAERVVAIARLMSGENISEEAKRNAEQLMELAESL